MVASTGRYFIVQSALARWLEMTSWNCCCAGLRKNQRKAISVRPQAMLEAKDLPQCDLSNYLSRRISDALEKDRLLRAQRDGLPLEQVTLPVSRAALS
jgi:hypothetical protein